MFCPSCGAQREVEYRFCGNCGDQFIVPNPNEGENIEESLIKKYFHDGHTYSAIVCLLENYGVNLGVRTLKRRLVLYGLDKSQNVDDATLSGIMQTELQGPASNLGYRNMWNLLRTKYNIRCPRDKVMNLLQELDPEGVVQRRSRVLRRRRYTSRGPNDTWHIDGYDKLKPYGLPIHGAIDGFSRKILWLKVCKSNNDPCVPAAYYLDTIKDVNMIPKLLRTDLGTENGLAAAIQCTLHNTIGAHRYGTSVSNQRIESWWSSLRKSYSGWVIDFFKRKIDDGTFVTGSKLYEEVCWFSFSPLIQKDLDHIVKNWNTHRIRSSGENVIGGVPNELYNIPNSFGYVECGQVTREHDLNRIDQIDEIFDSFQLKNSMDDDIKDYCEHVVASRNIPWPPSNWTNAEFLFDAIIACS
eukprot:TCONS_00059303-protein